MRHGWKHSAETEKLSQGGNAKTELGGDCDAYVSVMLYMHAEHAVHCECVGVRVRIP